MPKKVYCAACGQELFFAIKALPKQCLTITIIEPHECLEETAENPYKDKNEELIPKPKKVERDIDKMFDGFEFSKSLGGKDSIPATTVFDKPSGDKRSKDQLFDEGMVNSLAPQGILQGVQTLGNSTPENPITDLDE